MPWIIADIVVDAASQWLNTDLSEEWTELLDAKAERCFARHKQFHRLICSKASHGNAGRDTLYMFMRHWLAGILYTKRRDLHRLLPQSYCLGAPLPSSPLADISDPHGVHACACTRPFTRSGDWQSPTEATSAIAALFQLPRVATADSFDLTRCAAGF